MTGFVVVYLGNVNLSFDGFWLGLGADGHIEATTVSGNLAVYDQAESTSSAVIGEWQHGRFDVQSSTSRIAYLNGGNAGTAAAPVTPAAAITGISIGAGYGASGIGYFNGRLAEVGVWDAALTAADAASLARGVSPLFIKRNNLVAYWPIIGRASPDVDVTGGVGLSIFGGPPAAPHCRMFYPAPVWPAHPA